MKTDLAHPNEPGRWTLLERAPKLVLWRRERSDPFPVTQFYLVRPGAQFEILYQEEAARASFDSQVGATSDHHE